jgi:hypothetical protein
MSASSKGSVTRFIVILAHTFLHHGKPKWGTGYPRSYTCPEESCDETLFDPLRSTDANVLPDTKMGLKERRSHVSYTVVMQLIYLGSSVS